MSATALPRPKSVLVGLLAAAAVIALAPAGAQAEVRSLPLANQPLYGRANPAVIKLYDGKVLLAGGNTGNAARDTYDIFDPAGDSGKGSWTHHTGMNGGSWGGANGWWRQYLFNLGGAHHKVLLVANRAGSTGYSSSIYDPVDDTWSTPVDTGRGWASGCAQSSNGTIACSVSGLSVYDAATDSWTQTGLDTGWWPSSIAGLDDGKFLVVTNNSGPDYNQAYIFNSADNSFTATGNAPHTLIEASMFRLPNGKVLSVGGSTDSNNVNVSQTYLWDPATGNWSTAGYPTGTGTAQPTGDMWGASQDSDGNVYFTAGQVLSSKFDASTGQWDASAYRVAVYEDARGPEAGIPLKLDDGRVIVFGGGPSVDAAGWWRRTSAAFVVANVPVVTANPVLDVSSIGIDEPATLTSDAVWDTSGLTLNKRWQLCTSSSTSDCADYSDATGSTVSVSTDLFKLGYRYARRVETTEDPNVGTIAASTMIPINGPPAPSADPAPSVDFASSGEYAAGTVLHRTQGTWTGHVIGAVTAKWQRCGDFGSGWECQDLPDAATYTVTQEDIDRYVLIKYSESVTDDLNQTSTSDASGWVAPISPPNASCCTDFSFPASSHTDTVPVGQTLTLDPADINWNHAPDTAEYKWQYYDDGAGEWTDIAGAAGTSLNTAGIAPGTQVQLSVRGTSNGLTGSWNQVAYIYVNSNMWTPNGDFNWDTGNGRCTSNGTLADLRVYGGCGDLLSDARYYEADGSNRGDAYDDAWSTWLATDNGDGTFAAQTLVDQGSNGRLEWKRPGAHGTDSWTSGTWGADDEIDGLKIGVRYRPSTTLDLVAKVVKLTNTTSEPISRRLIETLNFGSDSRTGIHGQSTGGVDAGDGSLTLDPAARWFVTADNPIGGGIAGDPVNTSVFSGPRAAVTPTTSLSSDNLGASFDLTIPAGETRYIVYFFGLGSILQPAVNDPAVAVANAQTLFSEIDNLPSELLVDVPVGDRNKILNWSFVPPVVDPTVSFKGWGTTASGLAKFSVGGPAGAQIEVSNFANFKSPVTVSVGRWGSIKTLAKKLGAGQVTLYYRVKGQPSTAASAVVNYDFAAPFISANSVRWLKTAKGIWNVHLVARDRTCPGCDPKLQVQVAYGKSRPSDAEAFPTRLLRDLFDYKVDTVIKAPNPPRWVRVSDSQGNVSRWKALVGAPAYPRV